MCGTRGVYSCLWHCFLGSALVFAPRQAFVCDPVPGESAPRVHRQTGRARSLRDESLLCCGGGRTWEGGNEPLIPREDGGRAVLVAQVTHINKCAYVGRGVKAEARRSLVLA